MTTLDPGASVVFTHGWARRPLSTAFLASRAAPSITCGLEVLVQDVIDAITTAPWSSSYSVPSGAVTGVGLWALPAAARLFDAGASDAGKLSAPSASVSSSPT